MSMNDTPFHHQPDFHQSGSAPVNPDEPSGIHPAMPENNPDQNSKTAANVDPEPSGQVVIDPDQRPDEIQENVANIDPDLSGSITQVPDGWLTRTEAQERLSLADIEIDSRRMRHLCARNELESVKVKNEKNQPQYFINPASVEQYLSKNTHLVVEGRNLVDPDNQPDHSPEPTQEPEPAASSQPEPQLDQTTPEKLAGASSSARSISSASLG